MNPKPLPRPTLALLGLVVVLHLAVVLANARPAYAHFTFEMLESLILDGGGPAGVMEGSDGAVYRDDARWRADA